MGPVKMFQYLDEDPGWKETNITGTLSLLEDLASMSHFFQITDPKVWPNKERLLILLDFGGTVPI
jgi:hypothetical protein